MRCWASASEARRLLKSAQDKQTSKERQQQAEYLRVMTQFVAWQTETSGLAQEMGLLLPFRALSGRSSD